MWGAFSHYALQFKRKGKHPFSNIDEDDNPLLIAAVAASHFTRLAAKSAYDKKKRGLVTPDILNSIDIF